MYGMIPFNHNDMNLFDYLDKMERNFWDGSISSSMQFRCDVREQDNSFLLEAELPGFEKDDIGLDLKDDTLTITAHREESSESKDKNYVHQERRFGSFSRSFDVTGIDADNISASYRNGILTLTLPKKQPQVPTARRIEIAGE